VTARRHQRDVRARRRSTRFLLWWLAGVSVVLGAYGSIAPHSFYRHVIGVDRLGAYDQHLLSDIGGFYLGFALLFALAARSMSRELVRASCFAWMVTQVLHFAYHLFHLEHLTAAEIAAQTVGLGLLLVLPVAILTLSRDGLETR
jgi:hypothetical protein